MSCVEKVDKEIQKATLQSSLRQHIIQNRRWSASRGLTFTIL